jgi:hypothetical protein
MEANDNKQIGLRKAINAHEQALAALNDLSGDSPSPAYPDLIARITANIEALQAESQVTDPAEHT